MRTIGLGRPWFVARIVEIRGGTPKVRQVLLGACWADLR